MSVDPRDHTGDGKLPSPSPSSSSEPGSGGSRSRAGGIAPGGFLDPEAYAGYRDNPDLEERNGILLRMLPEDARTVLDVGCGPGVAGRALAGSGRTVFSLDASRAALGDGPPRPVCGSATDLPFPDRSFDAVVSLEMLEHLPAATLYPVAREMERTARRWILLGVPDRENLLRNQLRCPACGHRFHRSGHLNRFDRRGIAALFPRGRLVATRICGPPVRDYPRPLLRLRHGLARRFSEMSGAPGDRCPRCGETRFPRFRHNLLSFGLDGLNRLLSRRRPYWLLALLEIGGGGEGAGDRPRGAGRSPAPPSG